MRQLQTVLLFSLICSATYSQTGQISIPRVDAMPNGPAPYVMRDWDQVARDYDAFVFDLSRSGTFLPLSSLKPSGKIYPDVKPIQLDTYVGTTSETQAEAINIIPAIVGASLAGIDKANQSSINWVEKIKDFYNSAHGQNIYLNGTSSASGNDWWYDVMPNVFFYQAFSLYPDEQDFETQFTSVANRWLEAVHAMGGKTAPWTLPEMNYRGWYFSSMTGNSTGVHEPEAAGAIGWLLYQAYSHTGEKKYLEGAQLALDYLNSLTSNPSYELQLPYGTLAAAKLNAINGAQYDVEKFLNWSFNKGDLRGWGTIVGQWDGKDVSGLVGEANDAGNDYAFMMNGYQQVAALAPVAKYDKRFARAIGKWILNVANASRLYYPAYLDAAKQDDFEWSSQYDPGSVIGYEALKENQNGKALYGTGDAKRNGWAGTNLALYGSSHVGYLAAVVGLTNVERILKLDLNKTDFYADASMPVFLIYNSYDTDQIVSLNEGAGPFDVYDAISESFLANNVSGNFTLTIKSDEAMVVTIVPAGAALTVKGNKMYANGVAIDYHYGYDFNAQSRIKALSSDKSVVEFNKPVTVYATVESAAPAKSYRWYLNDIFTKETTTGEFAFSAPASEGTVEIRVQVDAGTVLQDSTTVSVLAVIPTAPVITNITADQDYYISGTNSKIVVEVQNAETTHITYEWRVSGATFTQNDSLITWTPQGEGVYRVSCIVRNEFGLSSEATLDVLVKLDQSTLPTPVAYYPLNIDVNDYSGNNYNAKKEGTQEAADALGVENSAYRFSSGADIIYVDNKSTQNFRDAITVSFWIKPGSAGHEAFILSHGSWEERWKVSVTPDQKLRWTVKTENGVRDIDSRNVLPNQFVHVTCIYSGYSMELYLDGALDNFSAHDGKLMTTAKPITFGQKDYDARQYFYNGVLDEVRLYDQGLHPGQVEQLKDLWIDQEPVAVNAPTYNALRVYPIPALDGKITIEVLEERIIKVEIISTDGRVHSPIMDESFNKAVVKVNGTGLFFLRVTTDRRTHYARVVVD